MSKSCLLRRRLSHLLDRAAPGRTIEDRMGLLRWLRSWQIVSVLVVTSGMFSFATLQAQQAMQSHPLPSSRGSGLFAKNCSDCHGADGRGGDRAPDIATASEVQQLSDSDLIGIVQNGISGAGMPAFGSLGPQKVKDIVDYLRILQGKGTVVRLPGDPRAGEALFFGKAQCSACHMINGKGGFIGSDLSHYGANSTVNRIREVITDPDKALPAQSKPVTVVTRQGEKFTGLIRSKDNFSISIQTMDGSFHFFQKSNLKQIDPGAHSLMPGNYGSTLNSRELNDLISYLINAGTNNANQLPGKPSTFRHDDDSN